MSIRDILLLLINLGMAAAGVWLMMRALHHSETPEAMPGWVLSPPEMPRSEVKTVLVAPQLMLGEEALSVRVWLPLRECEAERFRQERGALMLSAAIALTADRLEGAERRDWLRLLHIDPDNFVKKHHRLDEIMVDGQRGVLVLDGLATRGFFVGGRELAAACTHFAQGDIKRLGRADRALLDTLPPEALIYATCTVNRDQAGELVYLGAVLPIAQPTMAADFYAALTHLRQMGIETAFLPCDAATARAAEAAYGAPLPNQSAGAPGVLQVMPTEAPTSAAYDAPVEAMLGHQRALRVRRLRGLAMSAALGLAAVCGGSFFLCTALCFGALLLRLTLGERDTLARPAELSARGLGLALLPGLALPLAVGLTLLLAVSDGAWLSFGSGYAAGLACMALLCWLMPGEGERGAALWLPPLCILAAAVLAVLFGWLTGLLGLALGLAGGLALVRVLSAAFPDGGVN